MKTKRCVSCLLVCAAAACFGKDDEPRTREEFCRDWADAACSDDVVDNCQAKDAEACHTSQEAFCRALVPEDFSDRGGDACISAVESAYADAELEGDELATVLKLGAPCDRLIVGPKDRGETCRESTDCDLSAGLTCVRKSGEAEGKCQAPEVKGAGRDCEAAQATCEEGFYCDGSNCIEAKDAGDECTIQEECGESNFCNDEGQCVARIAVDEPCNTDVECRSGICYEFEGETTCTDHVILSRAEPMCDELK